MNHRILTAGSILAAVLSANAALAAPLEKGTTELRLGGSIEHVSFDGGSTTSLNLGGVYGYCVNEKWEFGPGLDLSSLSAGGQTFTNFDVSGNAVYNFSSHGGRQIPFLTGALGIGTVSGGGGPSETTMLIPRLGGGIRMLVGNSASVNFAALFEHRRFSVSGISASENALLVQVGLSIYPKGHGG